VHSIWVKEEEEEEVSLLQYEEGNI